MNFEFSVFSSFQYIVVIILFDAKNVPSLASRTLPLAPGPALIASLLSGTIVEAHLGHFLP